MSYFNEVVIFYSKETDTGKADSADTIKGSAVYVLDSDNNIK